MRLSAIKGTVTKRGKKGVRRGKKGVRRGKKGVRKGSLLWKG
jgi:hypothetical protein